jgi:hypothetical protein
MTLVTKSVIKCRNLLTAVKPFSIAESLIKGDNTGLLAEPLSWPGPLVSELL